MKGFELSVGRQGAPLHAAAHSHHPWPDASMRGHRAAWRDAARLLDGKWDRIFEEVIPAAQHHIAGQLKLPDPRTIAFGPNTHSFVVRLLSSLPTGRPPRILTTGSEFMSFSRQIARLEEDGLVELTRIATEPFDNFEKRFTEAAQAGGHDLVFLSQVYFDSAFALQSIERIMRAVPSPETFIVIDGYHGFMAVPTDLSAIADRAFYLAGGYKYAMAGEGACFLHCPPGFGMRPRDTGWYAGFGALEAGAKAVPYDRDGSRFLGATFDVSGLYRFNAVQEWLASQELSVAKMLEHVRGIERAFLTELDRQKTPISRAMLLLPDESQRGRFLAFRTRNASAIADYLGGRKVIVDYRGDRLRIGFGIYHETEHALRLAWELAQ